MASPINLWEQELLTAHSRLTSLFHSASSQQRCLAYLRGLLRDVERKNGWQLAEWLGERSPDNIQYFLERAHWDAEAARDVLRDYVIEHLGDEQGILIIDETGFIKKGTHSAGVQRQYSGTAGMGMTAACDAGWKPGINLLSSRSLRMNNYGGKRLAMSGRT
ncbi:MULTISPECIES: transposase [Xenorhabdus]|uniref:transposase n=1 Tax=Xenorhabdus sp. GDc328 TaxID=742178 RepID=UPI001910F2B2